MARRAALPVILLLLVTTLVGWLNIINATSATDSENSRMLTLQVVVTLGAVVAIWGLTSDNLSVAVAGLLVSACSITGFAYLGNIAEIALAILVLIRWPKQLFTKTGGQT